MHHLWYVLAKIIRPNLIKLLTQRQISQKCRGQRTCQIKLWNSNQPRPGCRKFSRKTDPNSSGYKRHNPRPQHTHTHPKKGGKTFTDGNPLNSMLAKHNGWILFGSWFEQTTSQKTLLRQWGRRGNIIQLGYYITLKNSYLSRWVW